MTLAVEEAGAAPEDVLAPLFCDGSQLQTVVQSLISHFGLKQDHPSTRCLVISSSSTAKDEGISSSRAAGDGKSHGNDDDRNEESAPLTILSVPQRDGGWWSIALSSALAAAAGAGVVTTYVVEDAVPPNNKGTTTAAAAAESESTQQIQKVHFKDEISGANKALAVRPSLLMPKSRVLLASAWVETGEYLEAAVQLVEQCSVTLVGVAAVRFDRNNSTNPLWTRYDVFAQSMPVGSAPRLDKRQHKVISGLPSGTTTIGNASTARSERSITSKRSSSSSGGGNGSAGGGNSGSSANVNPKGAVKEAGIEAAGGRKEGRQTGRKRRRSQVDGSSSDLEGGDDEDLGSSGSGGASPLLLIQADTAVSRNGERSCGSEGGKAIHGLPNTKDSGGDGDDNDDDGDFIMRTSSISTETVEGLARSDAMALSDPMADGKLKLKLKSGMRSGEINPRTNEFIGTDGQKDEGTSLASAGVYEGVYGGHVQQKYGKGEDEEEEEGETGSDKSGRRKGKGDGAKKSNDYGKKKAEERKGSGTVCSSGDGNSTSSSGVSKVIASRGKSAATEADKLGRTLADDLDNGKEREGEELKEEKEGEGSRGANVIDEDKPPPRKRVRSKIEKKIGTTTACDDDYKDEEDKDTISRRECGEAGDESGGSCSGGCENRQDKAADRTDVTKSGTERRDKKGGVVAVVAPPAPAASTAEVVAAEMVQGVGGGSDLDAILAKVPAEKEEKLAAVTMEERDVLSVTEQLEQTIRGDDVTDSTVTDHQANHVSVKVNGHCEHKGTDTGEPYDGGGVPSSLWRPASECGQSRGHYSASFSCSSSPAHSSPSPSPLSSVQSSPVRAGGTLSFTPVHYSSSIEANNPGEDRHSSLIREDLGVYMYCICDGHGGSNASHFAVDKLLHMSMSALLALVDDDGESHLQASVPVSLASAAEEQVKNALRDAFLECDKQWMQTLHAKTEMHGTKGYINAGSCAILAALIGRKLFVAHVGDCRAIIATADPQHLFSSTGRSGAGGGGDGSRSLTESAAEAMDRGYDSSPGVTNSAGGSSRGDDGGGCGDGSSVNGTAEVSFSPGGGAKGKKGRVGRRSMASVGTGTDANDSAQTGGSEHYGNGNGDGGGGGGVGVSGSKRSRTTQVKGPTSSRSWPLHAVALSRDHNCDNSIEADLVRNRSKDSNAIRASRNDEWKGNKAMLRVAGSLAVTRAIGDAYLKHEHFSLSPFKEKVPYITAEPEVSFYHLNEDDEFFVLATDGIWEQAANDEVVGWVAGNMARTRRERGPSLVSSEAVLNQVLGKAAQVHGMSVASLRSMAKGSSRRNIHDDLTATVVHLNPSFT